MKTLLPENLTKDLKKVPENRKIRSCFQRVCMYVYLFIYNIQINFDEENDQKKIRFPEKRVKFCKKGNITFEIH